MIRLIILPPANICKIFSKNEMRKDQINANEMSSVDIERIRRQRDNITSSKNASPLRIISATKDVIDIEERRRRILFASEKDFVFENTGFLVAYTDEMRKKISEADFLSLSFRATAEAPSARTLAVGKSTEIGPGCNWDRYRKLANAAGYIPGVISTTRMRAWVVGLPGGDVMVWDLDVLDASAVTSLISDSINSKNLYCYNAAELLTWAMSTARAANMAPAAVYDPLWHVRYVDPDRIYDISRRAVIEQAAAALVKAHKKSSPPTSLEAIMHGAGMNARAVKAAHDRAWSVAPLSTWHYRNAVLGHADPHRVMMNRGWEVCATNLPTQLVQISCNGMPVDIDRLESIRCDAAAVVAKAASTVVEHIPSLYEIQARLSAMSGGATDEIRLAVGEYARSTGVELDASDNGLPSISLKSLSNKGAIALPGIAAWRDLCDARRTLASCDDLIASVSPNGRLHPLFGYDTVTGRLTAKRPASMAMDQRLRSAVTAPEGSVIISADYSQIELRIAACFAEKMRAGTRLPGMLATAFRTGVDPHLTTALQSVRQRGDINFTGNAAAYIAGLCDEERCELKSRLFVERDTAKAQNFGLLYGMKDSSFWEYGRLAYGLTWTFEEAQAARDAWFKMYPEIALLHDSYQSTFSAAAKETLFLKAHDGVFQTTTSRVVSGATLSGRKVTATSPFLLLSYACQGTGADIIISAIASMDHGTRRHLVNVVHDELVLCVPESCSQREAAEVRRAMLSAEDAVFAQYNIPASVDITVGNSWS